MRSLEPHQLGAGVLTLDLTVSTSTRLRSRNKRAQLQYPRLQRYRRLRSIHDEIDGFRQEAVQEHR